MPRESSLRDQLRETITSLPGFVTNHEDKFQKGVGDTSFGFDACVLKFPGYFSRRFWGGWFELKHHHTWPKMWSTELKIGLSPEQRIWIRDRWKHAQDVWILVRICDDIYMFYGKYADELYFPISQQRFEAIWCGKWHKRIDQRELVELICATNANQ